MSTNATSVVISSFPNASMSQAPGPEVSDRLLEIAAKTSRITEEFRQDIGKFYKFYYGTPADPGKIDSIFSELRRIKESANPTELERLSKPKNTRYHRDNIADLVHLIFFNLIANEVCLGDIEASPAPVPVVPPPQPPPLLPANNRSQEPSESKEEWMLVPIDATGDADGLDPETRELIAKHYFLQFNQLLASQKDHGNLIFRPLWKEIGVQANRSDFIESENIQISPELIKQASNLNWTDEQRKKAQEIFTSLNNCFDQASSSERQLKTSLKTRIILCECLFPKVDYEKAETYAELTSKFNQYKKLFEDIIKEKGSHKDLLEEFNLAVDNLEDEVIDMIPKDLHTQVKSIWTEEEKEEIRKLCEKAIDLHSSLSDDSAQELETYIDMFDLIFEFGFNS